CSSIAALWLSSVFLLFSPFHLALFTKLHTTIFTTKKHSSSPRQRKRVCEMSTAASIQIHHGK
ncbi:hypothetical protein Mgra_00009139, partial [Meloidogyne graminicola]